MAMDLDVATYAPWDDLLGYMDGSAAVIGEMMLPILEPPTHAAAFEPARELGLAFQLTNFLRDVGEDLDRGRVYLPEEDLDRFGADPWARTVTPAWRELMRFEIDRARALYASADQGIPCCRRGRRPASAPPAGSTPHPRRDRGQRLRRVLEPGPGVDRAQTGHRHLVPRRHDLHEKAVGPVARPNAMVAIASVEARHGTGRCPPSHGPGTVVRTLGRARRESARWLRSLSLLIRVIRVGFPSRPAGYGDASCSEDVRRISAAGAHDEGRRRGGDGVHRCRPRGGVDGGWSRCDGADTPPR